MNKEQAFEAGWRVAAQWANRDDLTADIGSPAYLAEMSKVPGGEAKDERARDLISRYRKAVVENLGREADDEEHTEMVEAQKALFAALSSPSASTGEDAIAWRYRKESFGSWVYVDGPTKPTWPWQSPECQPLYASPSASTAESKRQLLLASGHGNAEDLWIESERDLNCPACGGSGHVDDISASTADGFQLGDVDYYELLGLMRSWARMWHRSGVSRLDAFEKAIDRLDLLGLDKDQPARATADELPGMWEQSDLIGGATDTPPAAAEADAVVDERKEFDKIHVRGVGAPSFRIWSKWNEIEKTAAWEAWQARAALPSAAASGEASAVQKAGVAIPLSTIHEWLERRMQTMGPAGITSARDFAEEVVRWTEKQHAAATPAVQEAEAVTLESIRDDLAGHIRSQMLGAAAALAEGVAGTRSPVQETESEKPTEVGLSGGINTPPCLWNGRQDHSAITPAVEGLTAEALIESSFGKWRAYDYEDVVQIVKAALAASPVPMASSAGEPVADGWRIVPNSATHNMLNAANAGRKRGRSSSGDIYRTMIDNAPPYHDLAPRQEKAAQVAHDWPACAVFRGGKCTCDAQDDMPSENPAMVRYRFLMALMIDRGVLTDKRYNNGTWSLQGIYGVDDSGLRGAGTTPEEAIDNAIVAARLDPNDRLTHWRETHERIPPAASLREQEAQPKLAVWFGSMPESNGKANWTVTLHREGEAVWSDGAITFCRSEYHDRMRYEADRLRWLIGEIATEPDILSYDENMLSPPDAQRLGRGKDGAA